MKRSDLIREGMGMALAGAVLGGVDNGRTSAGTTQANAAPIRESVTVFTTVAASSGARLPAVPEIGDDHMVCNFGASALLVYPPVGNQINALALNAGFSLAAGTSARFKKVTATRWVSY